MSIRDTATPTAISGSTDPTCGQRAEAGEPSCQNTICSWAT
ncbi:hypothetical protein [Amycolatopsis sp. NBC_00355]